MNNQLAREAQQVDKRSSVGENPRLGDNRKSDKRKWWKSSWIRWRPTLANQTAGVTPEGGSLQVLLHFFETVSRD
jgi:hypothetical protein